MSRFAYDDAATERRIIEPPKRASSDVVVRGEFERDRARVLHSYAFRRLADKTQVVVPGEDDFPRTRLTHSLEVAQIAREIGAALGCDPDVVDTAGLAHDIGHPPFGHNGEEALNRIADDIGGFEGNAQTLRVLTRLEANVLDEAGRPAGLNLTRGSLDATVKYPWARRASTPKFNYYESDEAAFAWVRSGVPAGLPADARCLEAQVMDWADDVAYSVHDLEDGIHSGLIALGSFDDTVRQQLCEVAEARYSYLPAEELAPTLDSLLELPALRDLAGYDGSPAAQAAGKRATSELVGRLAGAPVNATRERYGPDPLGRYEAGLVVPDTLLAECALLKAMGAKFVQERPGEAERRAWQRQVLTELVSAIYDAGPEVLDPGFAAAWHEAGRDDSTQRRVVIDQVSKLTDSAAYAWHSRLVRPIREPTALRPGADRPARSRPQSLPGHALPGTSPRPSAGPAR